MKNPNGFFSNTIRFSQEIKGEPFQALRSQPQLTVSFDGDRVLDFDQRDPRSPAFVQVLSGLKEQGMPVYLEVNPASRTIKKITIPHVGRILKFVQNEERTGINLVLENSHGLHLLKNDSTDYPALKATIDQAIRGERPVALVEDDDHSIIDIFFYKPVPDGNGPRFPELPKKRPWPWAWLRDFFRRVYFWPWWPWWWFGCISAVRAQQVFDAMAATTCNPNTVPVPCIPFLYPDDGCWGRAHEMCRLMIGMGLSPKKTWIDGQLTVRTRNSPNCFVRWGWHVAPTLCVRLGFMVREQMVIDPSLFSSPVTKSTWKSVQGDPNATLTDTAYSVFLLRGNITDPTYSQTNSVLAYYRLQLLNRSLNFGQPPYANCP